MFATFLISSEVLNETSMLSVTLLVIALNCFAITTFICLWFNNFYITL